tara:strand:- start:901 stop:1386 length:486 start_codon:yes stop_codon:yes gene_type:complete
MIQAITKTTFQANLSTEDNRIDTGTLKTQIRFLVKLINDMDGAVVYCYPNSTINNRYTSMNFVYEPILANVDFYAAEVHLLPAGHWKYEVYEVSWIGTLVVGYGTAPANENNVLPIATTNGVVQGIVTKGILNLTEKLGTEQVQYTQHAEPSETNTIYYGQ